MLAKEEMLLIVYFTVVILLLTAFAIVFFITFQRRKNKLLMEKFETEKRFEEELTQSRLEIQEQTLKNVAWELHDNIGQLLSVANMQLNMLSGKVEESSQGPVLEIRNIVASSLQEVRSLSKSLNNEVIDYSGLEASVKNELDRFTRLNILDARMEVTGESFEIHQKDAIILFRILQEFFSNVIKHSRASLLSVNFKFEAEHLIINARDNGVGFEVEDVQKNSGLLNMKSRAEVINTQFDLTSSKDVGTSLSLSYPLTTCKE